MSIRVFHSVIIEPSLVFPWSVRK